tara:strand:- start:511 stop:897 length:387 start_codon:yes stop_codon:yes gene_type:complete
MDYKYHDGGRAKDYGKVPKIGDCVIRSIAIATGQGYMVTLIELCELAVDIGGVPNDKWVYEKYLASKGFIKSKPPRTMAGRKIRIKDWFFEGACVMLTTGHLTAIIDNCVYDTGDCRRWCGNTYWKKG